MAIYHLTARTGSRASGQSAKAKADYIQREGKYARDASEVLYSASGHMPAWVIGSSEYWGAADLYERANGRLFKEVEFALPVELTLKEQRLLVDNFVRHLTASERLPHTVAIHAGRGENPHVHLMISERRNDGIARPASRWFSRYNAKNPDRGGAQKSESLKPKEWLEKTREAWAEYANKALALAGHDDRIDHRTLDKQGIERVPGIHLGPRVVEMEGRGIRTDRADVALSIDKANSQIFDLQRYRGAIEDERNIEGEEFSKRERTSGGDRAVGSEYGGSGRRSSTAYYGDAEGEFEAGRKLVSPAGAGYVSMANGSPGHESDSSRTNSGYPKRPQRGPWVDVEVVGGGVGSFDDAYSGAADRIVSLAGLARSGGSGEPSVCDQALVGDRTAEVVSRQLNALGCDWYNLGIREVSSGKLISREWASQEIFQSVVWLKRMNARGHDIYIRPGQRVEHGLILLDGLSIEGLTLMKRKGHEPAVVLETRPGAYQAWVKVADKAPLAYRTIIGDELARDYGVGFVNDGRLAGFTNQSYRNLKPGYYPWILCQESNGKVSSKGPELIIKAEQLLESIKQTEEVMNRRGGRGFRR